MNCILSIKTKFLFRINAMYFSNLFGITSILTPKFLSPKKIYECHKLLDYQILQERF